MAYQIYWQADHFFWFPPQKVVGSWSPMPISWSAAFPQIPRVEFHLSGALCKFLRSIANKGELGRREGFPNEATRACMHPLSSKAELRQPISFDLHAYLIANLVDLLTSYVV